MLPVLYITPGTCLYSLLSYLYNALIYLFHPAGIPYLSPPIGYVIAHPPPCPCFRLRLHRAPSAGAAQKMSELWLPCFGRLRPDAGQKARRTNCGPSVRLPPSSACHDTKSRLDTSGSAGLSSSLSRFAPSGAVGSPCRPWGSPGRHRASRITSHYANHARGMDYIMPNVMRRPLPPRPAPPCAFRAGVRRAPRAFRRVAARRMTGQEPVKTKSPAEPKASAGLH